MNWRSLSLIMGLILCSSQTVWSQQQQQPPPAKKTPPAQVRVFYLQYVSAQEAANVATEILDAFEGKLKIAAEPRTNALIVSGTKESLEVLEKILEQIDKSGAANEKRTIKKYRLLNDAELTQRVLATLMTGSDARLETTKDGIIVYGSDNTHTKVQAILEQLAAKQDAKTTESYYIHLVWIVGGGDAAKKWNLHKIPEPLRELVEKKLAPRLALESPQMVGQVLVRTSLADGSGKITANGSGELSDTANFELNVDAVVEKMEDGLSLQLELNTMIRKALAVSANSQGGALGRQNGSDNNLSTKIALKLDHPVCLGTTPTNGVNSVFLIQVSRDIQ